MAKAPNTDILNPDLNRGYGQWSLPCSRDDEIREVVHALVEIDIDGEVPLRPEHTPVLLAFSERMATFARRQRSPSHLRTGLLAAGLTSSAVDVREAVLVLPLLWRTAEVLALDARQEFLVAADRLRGGEILVNFAGRAPEDQSIESMGYVEVEDEAGFRYERRW